MSLKVEKLDGNMAKLTIEVDAADVEKAITRAYQKVKGQISIPGFRKGKVPQKMVEKQYGVEVFYEDAANFMINDTYREEVKDCEVEIVSSPEIDVEQLERGKSFIYTAMVATKPEVTLGQYKGLEYTAVPVEVTDEDIENEVNRTRELNSRRVPVEDRPAQEGDIVDIDFEGSVDGEPFEGGQGTNYTLTLGSHTFVDTFEDQVAGHNIGDEFDVNVTFPENYKADLAGKAAVFKCKLNEIKVKELPAADDEFAAEVSDFDTLEEYKADIKKNMEEAKKEEAKRMACDELVVKAIENAEMVIPEPMLMAQAEQTARDFEMRMEQSGISLQQYMQMVGQTPEQFMEEVKPVAKKTIEQRLTLEAICKAENIEVSDEELEAEIKKMAEMYQMEYEKLAQFLSPDEREGIKVDIAVNKAADFLYDNGVAVEKKEEAEAKEEAAAE